MTVISLVVCSDDNDDVELETIFDLGSSSSSFDDDVCSNRGCFIFNIFEYSECLDSSSDDSTVEIGRFCFDSYSPISILLAVAAFDDDDVVVVIVDNDRALHRTGNMPTYMI